VVLLEEIVYVLEIGINCNQQAQWDVPILTEKQDLLEAAKLAEEISQTITQPVFLYLVLDAVFSWAQVVLTKLSKK